ncbi:O-antigen ligase family protein [Cereibacter sphaeroides]|uniref:O-antigen ligase family protein n=1 Tax=Cereibacter sphaeroides TaxID=1063 RepID=UPI001F380BF5|nr:O-antigen ligase family protein [Cereibacter sphaeroides]MCE6959242.1 O-antigen ligase family protein [Cereibacter sphaeroides]MCE6972045.1 O-antigen ligase family protein [Cereibacter sphaeroides]
MTCLSPASAISAAPFAFPSSRPGPAEKAFALLVLAGLFNAAILDVLVGQLPRPDIVAMLDVEDHARWMASEANAGISLVFWPAAYLVSGLLFLRDALRWSVLRAGGTVLALCAVLLLSTVWSDAPRDTAMRAIHITGKSLFALWLVRRMGLRGTFGLLVFAGSAVLLAGWALALARPEVGWQAYRGETALRGFFTHKSAYGMAAMFTAFLGCALLVSGGVPDLKRAHLAMLSLVALASLSVSQSVTAVLMLALALLVFAAGRRVARGSSARQRRRRLFESAVFLALVIGSAWLVQSVILEAFGRDATLSRRTAIWDAILASQGAGNLLGHGYYGFWRYEPGSPLFEIVGREGFAASSPHNAFLLAWLDTGWLGLALFAGVILTAVLSAVRLLLRGGDGLQAMPLALAIVIATTGFVESNLFTGQEINWILLVIALAGSKLALRPSRICRKQS